MNDRSPGRPRRKYTLQSGAQYVWHNRRKLVRDTIAAVLAVLILATVFGQTDLPGWTYYVLLFAFFMAYTRFVEPWEWPDADTE